MSLATRFIPHSAHVKTAAAVDAWINQIESTTPQSGISLFEETTGSATDREFVAAKDIVPTIPITSSDLSFLATCGFGGVLISADGTHPGVIVYGRELPLGALPTAIGTAHHLTCAVSDGLLVPMSLRASHNQVAKLQLMLHAILGTGGNSGATPFVFTALQTITTGAGATSNIYTTGPCKYTISGGSSRLCQGISDIHVDFGIQILKEGTDGEVYPSHTSIISRMPKIEFSTKDVELITEVGDGLSLSAFSCYFRQVAANGQRVAAATTTHIGVAGTAGMLTPGGANLTHKRAGEVTFTFTPVINTNIITVSTTTAIPTS